MNDSGRSIVLAQDHQHSSRQHHLKHGDKMTYHFEFKNSNAKNNFIKLRALQRGEDEELLDFYGLENEDWSSKFALEEFGDFQVSFRDVQNIAKSKTIRNLSMSKNSSKAKTYLKKPRWSEPTETNSFRRFLKVSITTDDEATIFIILTEPNMPEFRINNYTSQEIRFYQKGLKNFEVERLSQPAVPLENKKKNMTARVSSMIFKNQKNEVQTFPVPFAWDDQTKKNRRLVLQINGTSRSYEIEEIEKKTPIKSKGFKYYVNVISTGYFREVEILEEKEVEEEEEEDNRFKRVQKALSSMTSFTKSPIEGINCQINLEGIGVSIIDEEPKEILYLSIYKIYLKLVQENKTSSMNKIIYETQEEYDIIISHMQIDNVISDENANILIPEDGLDKFKDLDDPDYTPFIQLKLSQTTNFHRNSAQRMIEALQLQIQPIKLECETKTIMIIISNVMKIVSIFNKEDQGPMADVVSSNQKQGNFSQAVTLKLDKNTENEFLPENQICKEDICDELIPKYPVKEGMENIKTDKMYFRLISISAIKIYLTLRIEKKALNFDLSKGFGALTILYTVFSSVLNISDAPMSFKSLVMKSVFHTQDDLISKITKNIISQTIFQIYKIFGSSDIIGNPVGFIDKFGSGVKEFFTEPSKGLLKSPKAFGVGIYRGTKALTTGLISAGFDSTSKVTGSWYNIFKSVSGQKVPYQKKPDFTWQGLCKGIVGGTSEVVDGVTGLVVQPYQGAKRKGPIGMWKGLGQGICGFVVSPLTCCLRWWSTFSTGVSRHAIYCRKGRLPKYGRFRFPRYISNIEILEPYGEEISRTNDILDHLLKGKFAKEEILYHEEFLIYKNASNRQNQGSCYPCTLILTDKHLVFVKDEKKILYKTKVSAIENVEVYEGGTDEIIGEKILHIYVFTTTNRNFVFQTLRYSLAEKTYQMLQREIIEKCFSS